MAGVTNVKPKMSTIHRHEPKKNLFLVDFVIDNPTVHEEVRNDSRKFHERLVKMFGISEVQFAQQWKSITSTVDEINFQMQECEWTLEIMCDLTISDMKKYNEHFLEYKKLM
ncbi:unnamed protein product, partial [Didymodactylos carnosus]